MKSAIRVFELTCLVRNPARRLAQLGYILCYVLNLKPVMAQSSLVSTPAVNYNDISITTIRPSTIPQIENSAVFVTYTITHKTVTNDRTGGTVCGTGYWKTCVWYPELSPGETETGQVMTTAPLAGHNTVAKIQFFENKTCPTGVECFPRLTASVDSPPIDVAAVYVVRLDGITIRRSKAGPSYNDQVLVNLAAGIGPPQPSVNPCEIDGGPDLVYCVVSRNEGFHTDSTFVISDVQVGPYTLIPEVTPDLRVSYAIVAVNTGPSETVGKVLNAISGAASAFLSSVYPQSSMGWSAANEWTKHLNSSMLADCDGPTAADSIVLLNKTPSNVFGATLANRTADGGGTLRISRDYDNQFTSTRSCGRSANYMVTWSVVRTSYSSNQ